MKKKKATRKSSPKKLPHNSNSSQVQRQRVIDALRKASNDGLTTIQLREDHDIMMPAPRIYELRWHYGYNIQLIWDRDSNAQGNEHSCGRYFLLPGKWQGEAA